MNPLKITSIDFVADASPGRWVWNQIGFVATIVNLNSIVLSRHFASRSIAPKSG